MLFDDVRQDVRRLCPLPVDEVALRKTVSGYEGVLYVGARPFRFDLAGRGLQLAFVPSEEAAQHAYSLLKAAEQQASTRESRRLSTTENDRAREQILVVKSDSWQHTKGDHISAPISHKGDYVISHRQDWRGVGQHNVSYRPPGEHHHVGEYKTAAAAKKAADEHAAARAKTNAHHVGYQRHNPKTGQLEMIDALGYSPEKPPVRDTKRHAPIQVNADAVLTEDDEIGRALLKFLVKRNPRNERQLRDAVESFVNDYFDFDKESTRKLQIKDALKYLYDEGIVATADAETDEEAGGEQDAWAVRKALAKVVVPNRFKPQGTKLIVDGQPVDVSADVEQACYAYAKRFIVKAGQVANQERFVKNFEASLRKLGVPKGDIDYRHFVKRAQTDVNKAPVAKTKAKKVAESPETRPDLYINQDGVMTRVLAAALPTGGFYTGGKGYGSWVPAVREEDLTLNVSANGAPAGWRGKVMTDPARDFYITWAHPIANKRGYIYLSRKQADLEKFYSCAVLSNHVEEMSEQCFHDLTSKKAPPERKAAALCVMLMDQHHIRVGNETFARQGTFGVASLLAKHVKIDGSVVKLSFVGKKKEDWDREIDFAGMPSALAFVKSCLKGKRPDEKLWTGAGWSVTSRNVNEYLAPFGEQGVKVTAKTLRTFHANRYMTSYLRKLEQAKAAYKLTDAEVRRLYKGVKLGSKDAALLSRKPGKGGERLSDFMGFHPYVVKAKEGRAKTVLMGALSSVASRLGHTTGACRNNYIDPVVVTRFAADHGWDERTDKERKGREDLPGYDPNE